MRLEQGLPAMMAMNYTINQSLLEQLNQQKAVRMVPAILYIIILMVVGLFGNALVIYAYSFRFKKTPSNYFILWLAILDFFACLITMPFEMLDLANPYTFTNAGACKTLRFLTATAINTSVFVLIAVSFDRYFKAFRPFQRFENKFAILFNLFAFLGSMVLSSPSLFIYGIKTSAIVPYNLRATECSIDDNMKGSKLPIAYQTMLFGLFFICVFIVVVLYGRLGREVFRRKTAKKLAKDATQKQLKRQRSILSTSSREEESALAVEDKPGESREGANKTENDKEHVKLTRVTSDKPDVEESTLRKKSALPHLKKIHVGKTTGILFCVTIAFVISFLPYLIAKLLQSFMKDFNSFTSEASEVGYNIAVRSFFLNNAVNPVIYSFLNPIFRQEARSILRAVFCCETKT